MLVWWLLDLRSRLEDTANTHAQYSALNSVRAQRALTSIVFFTEFSQYLVTYTSMYGHMYTHMHIYKYTPIHTQSTHFFRLTPSFLKIKVLTYEQYRYILLLKATKS